MNRPFLLSGVMSVILPLTLFAQSPVINEMMASNSGIHLVDEDGDASDWIEIYNPTGSGISLGGYYLSDKANDMMLWAFPDTVIGSGGFMVVFASNKDRAEAGAELHTNFAISAGGEQLYLSLMGEVVHTVPPVALGTDVSYGFITDGAGPMAVFTVPTPGASNWQGELQFQLDFSTEGGIYAEAFDLAVTTSVEGLTVRYTTDGSAPTASSDIISAPLSLGVELLSTADISQVEVSPPGQYPIPDPSDVPKVIVITAAAFTEHGQPVSDPVTHTYVIGELGMGHGNLPIVSIAIEPSALFDPDTGIFVPGVHWDASDPQWTGNYYQTGSAWERGIHVEFLGADGSTGFRQRAGLRTHGGNSRRFPQKGMRLYARSEYGQSRFNHAVFAEKPISSYKRFILRPFMSSWSGNGIEDILSNRLAVGLETDFLAGRMVAVYINGEFWGIYTMQERPDERYLEDNYGIDPDGSDIISAWWGEVTNGDSQDWHDLYDSMEAADLSDPVQYAAMAEHIDIANFIDYQLLHIFIANYDWPANNMRCWRDRSPGGKWRWIFFDGDAGLQSCDFGGFDHALSTSDQNWPTNAQSTLFLRRFLENTDFKGLFLERLEQLLNGPLSDGVAVPHYDPIRADMEMTVPAQVARFGIPSGLGHWEGKMLSTLDFLHCRPCEMVYQAEEVLGAELIVPQCLVSVPEPVTLYPNPTGGLITATTRVPFPMNSRIFIRDMTGRQVSANIRHDGTGHFYIDGSQLASGLYVVTIVSPRRAQTGMFLRE